MKASKTQLKEFRALVRSEIAKIIKEDEQIPSEKGSPDQEAPKEEEPENDRSNTLEKITYAYTKSLKNNLQQLSPDEFADAVNSILGHFGLGKDGKIQVLIALKNKIQS